MVPSSWNGQVDRIVQGVSVETWGLVLQTHGIGSSAGGTCEPVATLARINDIEVALVVLTVFIAVMMARGLWLLP